MIPPIWDCCGPTEGSFFTHGQIKNPAFFEGRCYTGQMIRQMWAESAVCLNSYLWRGWIFYLSMGKKWTPSRSTTTPDRWYQKFFIFGQLALPMMCEITTRNAIFFRQNWISTKFLLLFYEYLFIYISFCFVFQIIRWRLQKIDTNWLWSIFQWWIQICQC